MLESITSISDITLCLHRRLAELDTFETCACVGEPASPNIGSHLLWIALLRVAGQKLGARIGYCSSNNDFSETRLRNRVGDAPLLLRGGYLGDFWKPGGTSSTVACLRVIDSCHDRPIVMAPQSFAIAEPALLDRLATSFNAHPDLTIMARDRRSFELADSAFGNCKVLLTPDIVFSLSDLPLPRPQRPGSGILYLCRSDWQEQSWDASQLGLSDVVTTDWESYNRHPKRGSARARRRAARLRHQLWSNRIGVPAEWWSRRSWLSRLDDSWRPDGTSPKSLERSLRLVHTGIFQLMKYRAVITNRMHGHILCLLLKIPHAVVPGPYAKMCDIRTSWTGALPGARFVEHPRQVTTALRELLTWPQ
ncbi:N/A [soil metagenome]